MFRKGILAVVAALSVGVAGCAWETGDETVYQQAPKHQLDNGSITDPSGLGATTSPDVAAPDPSGTSPVQSGVSPVSTSKPEPEPQPWRVLPPAGKTTPVANTRIP